MKVAVTGGAGRLGRMVVAELMAHGLGAVALDRVKPPEPLGCPFVAVDFTDYGQVVSSLQSVDNRHAGIDAVVHLAAVPGPGHVPNPTLFANNIVSAYNVLAAAEALVVANVTIASSEVVHGVPFMSAPRARIDESSPVETGSTYGLAKILEERMAEQFASWRPSAKIIALRLAWVTYEKDYAVDGVDAHRHAANLWNYIDARDAAQAIRLAVTHEATGFHAFVIAADDTIMPQSNRELLDAVHPGSPIAVEAVERRSFYVNAKAKRVLGFQPRFGGGMHRP